MRKAYKLPAPTEALIKSPSEFLKSPMAQDEEKFPANTEVFKGESDEVLRHRARNSDGDLISASLAMTKQASPALRAPSSEKRA